MHTETELKLFVALQDYDSLVKTLNNFPHSTYCKSDLLFNHYFDTSTLQLAQWDMGLRIRGSKNHQEQTIKTAGNVGSGLHSRPEFNVTTAEKTPNLLLFPQHIWPNNTDLHALNNTLKGIFETNFSRETWLMKSNSCTIEIALDKGEVIAAQKTKLINELELELITGQTEDLIELALQIANLIPLRLAVESKALAGYLLSGKVPYQFKTDWPNRLNDAIASPTQNLKPLLKIALNHWLELERYLEHLSNNIREASEQTPPIFQLEKNAEYAKFFNQLIHCIGILQSLAFNDKKLKARLLLDSQIAAFIKILPKKVASFHQNSASPKELLSIEPFWRDIGYGKFQLVLLAYLTN
ncbi:inorganic triphosphatase [Shewanella holmiensis]|uniref:CYTH domain-containing protein n=1 Tax=Shewanella holmiensis TaxID=2952222 RepID=A0A9X2WKD5_9GAMM|nr:CYTH domain-containing protein [Shewanella holmiensis]MCT7940795.1 CYTH domain-containing protein [Shewanella holmiensis]